MWRSGTRRASTARTRTKPAPRPRIGLAAARSGFVRCSPSTRFAPYVCMPPGPRQTRVAGGVGAVARSVGAEPVGRIEEEPAAARFTIAGFSTVVPSTSSAAWSAGVDRSGHVAGRGEPDRHFNDDGYPGAPGRPSDRTLAFHVNQVSGCGVDVWRRVDAAAGVGVAIQRTAPVMSRRRTQRARPAGNREAVATETMSGRRPCLETVEILTPAYAPATGRCSDPGGPIAASLPRAVDDGRPHARGAGTPVRRSGSRCRPGSASTGGSQRGCYQVVTRVGPPIHGAGCVDQRRLWIVQCRGRAK